MTTEGDDYDNQRFGQRMLTNEEELLEKGYKVVTSTAPSSIYYSDRIIDVLPNTFWHLQRRSTFRRFRQACALRPLILLFHQLSVGRKGD